MTVQTDKSKAGPYAGAGTKGPFPVDFRFLEDAHLRVIKTDPDGQMQTLALGADYSVTGAGEEAGGELMLTANLPVGYTLVILRNVPATQMADYVEGDSFPAESHERALDKLTMLVQQNSESLGRALTFPESDIAVPGVLPPVAQRYNRYLSFDQEGKPVASTFTEEAMIAASQAAIAAADNAAQSEGNAAQSEENAAQSEANAAQSASYVQGLVEGAMPSVHKFVGDGVTTEFDFDVELVAAGNVLVFLDGANQEPITDYTVNGTKLVFEEAPSDGVKGVAFVSPHTALAIGDASNIIFVRDEGPISLAHFLRGFELSGDNLSPNAEWSDVPAHSDPAFDVQAQALADRTAFLFDAIFSFEKKRFIDLSHIDLPNGSDLSDLINDAIAQSVFRPVHVVLPHGVFDISKRIVAPSGSKGMILDFNGSTLKPILGFPRTGYIISLNSSTEFPVKLCNGTLDNERSNQNQFEITNPANLTGYNIFDCTAANVEIENFKFTHNYGQTTRTFCRNLRVKNVTIEDCGGRWYLNDGSDSFGDAFYIGTGWNTSGVITATFDNVVARGKYSRQYPDNHQSGSPLTQDMYSRIALTIERFGGDNANKVYAAFRNCDLRYYERLVHQERTGIDSVVYAENCRFDAAVGFGAYLSNSLTAFADNCEFNFYNSTYSGSKGLIRSYSGSVVSADFNKCKVTGYKNVMGMSGTVNMRNSSIYMHMAPANAILAEIVSGSIENTQITLSAHSTATYLFYACPDLTLKDSSLSVEGSARKEYSTGGVGAVNCTLKNVVLPVHPDKSRWRNNALLITNSETYTDNFDRYEVRKESGEVVSKDKVLWGIPSSAVYENLIYSERIVKADSTSIVSDALKQWVANQKVSGTGLFIMVYKGHNGTSWNPVKELSQTAYNRGYYLLKVKKDSTTATGLKAVGDIHVIGSTTAAGTAVYINKDTFAIESGAGETYSPSIFLTMLPWSMRETLPFLPDELT